MVGRREEGRGTVFRYVFGDRQQAGGGRRDKRRQEAGTVLKRAKKSAYVQPFSRLRVEWQRIYPPASSHVLPKLI